MNRLKDDRKVWLTLLLSIVTLGIYGIYIAHVMARDTNIVCASDGRRTRGVVGLLFFSFITLGIYSIFWEYSILTRWENFVNVSNEKPKCPFWLYLILCYLLSWTGICVLIAYILKINGLNQICRMYNPPLASKEKTFDNWGWKFEKK